MYLDEAVQAELDRVLFPDWMHPQCVWDGFDDKLRIDIELDLRCPETEEQHRIRIFSILLDREKVQMYHAEGQDQFHKAIGCMILEMSTTLANAMKAAGFVWLDSGLYIEESKSPPDTKFDFMLN